LVWWIGVVARQRGEPARTPAGPAKAGLFFATLGALVLGGLAAAATFFFTCTAGFIGLAALAQSTAGGEAILPILFFTAIIVFPSALGLFVCYRVLKRFWSRKD
jgi:hypothetical protein